MDLYEDTLYKRTRVGTIFKKPTLWINFEGMFIDLYHSNIPSCLFFSKINDHLCRELVTGRIFRRMADGCFFNDETGLFFNTDNFIPVNEVESKNCTKNDEYLAAVNYFFSYYEEFKKVDDEMIGKAELYMLTRGIDFRE